jgi:phenylalanyl-tRNA synthetase beta subunit
MKINYNWLQSYIAEPLPAPIELAEKIIFGAFEVENMDEIEAGSTILDIKTLPDRNHDCLSHQGVAREVAGLLGLTLNDMSQYYKIPDAVPTQLQVQINTPLCHRYMARIVRGITVGTSPDWVVEHLQSIGVTSVNNIVDAYNIVMYDCGQPCFISDLKSLNNNTLSVDSVVYPYNQVPTDQTTDIVLHIGNFNATAVRKQSHELNIPADVTKRFENEITPELCSYAMTELSALVAEMCPEAVFEEIVDMYPSPVSQSHVVFTMDYINTKLGTTLSSTDISGILDRYAYEYAQEGDTFTVAVPYERLDITGPHDMVEEIGRVYGYNNITPQMLPVTPVVQNDTYTKIQAIRADMISKGYYEVYNYTFTKKGDYEVARGPVGKSALRTKLLPGLEISYEMNRLNKDFLEIDNMKIFEIGSVFPSTGEVVHVAWMDGKQKFEMSIDEYVTTNNLSPETVLELPGFNNVQFTEWSDYPGVSRDVAVWVPEGVTMESVQDIINKHTGQYLVRGPRLFDTFTKDGKTSYAFRMVFQAQNKTLSESDITPIMENIYTALRDAGYEIR